MKKLLPLFLITFLCSCSLNNDSFHREFYHGSKESLQTFTRMIDSDDVAPGSSLNDWSYSKYLDVLIGKDTGGFEFKEYTYKMRPGYVGIYFDVSKTEIDNFQLNEFEESINVSTFYSLVGMFNLNNIQNPSIKDGYSRLSFKDVASTKTQSHSLLQATFDTTCLHLFYSMTVNKFEY
jgi:hypothetical protein